jgi:hypothetical protein
VTILKTTIITAPDFQERLESITIRVAAGVDIVDELVLRPQQVTELIRALDVAELGHHNPVVAPVEDVPIHAGFDLAVERDVEIVHSWFDPIPRLHFVGQRTSTGNEGGSNTHQIAERDPPNTKPEPETPVSEGGSNDHQIAECDPPAPKRGGSRKPRMTDEEALRHWWAYYVGNASKVAGRFNTDRGFKIDANGVRAMARRAGLLPPVAGAEPEVEEPAGQPASPPAPVKAEEPRVEVEGDRVWLFPPLMAGIDPVDAAGYVSDVLAGATHIEAVRSRVILNEEYARFMLDQVGVHLDRQFFDALSLGSQQAWKRSLLVAWRGKRGTELAYRYDPMWNGGS